MITSDVTAYIPDPDMSFWPTPPDIAYDLVYQVLMPWHCQGDGVRVLEPSVGNGCLATAIRTQLPRSHITCVEPHHDRAEMVRSLAGVADAVAETTIEDYLTSGVWEPFDLVIMNPPFTLPGRSEAWAEHILALCHDPRILAPGGLISAVVPRIVMTGRSRLVRMVRQLVLPHPYGITECEPGAFSSVGAQVSTALILIEHHCP